MAAELNFNGTVLVSALPATRARGIVLAAHGCRASGRVWFNQSVSCPNCVPLPEESCLAAAALASGFAVVAPTAADHGGCWTGIDVTAVGAALISWRKTYKLRNVPLLGLGTSSGGWLVQQAARNWPTIAALTSIVSVPPLGDVQPPLPRASSYPPLQLILMRKDTGKAKEAAALSAVLKPPPEVLESAPRKVDRGYFARQIRGLAPSVSSDLHAALSRAGYLKDDALASHPRRGTWRDAVRAALPKDRSLLPQRSQEVALDAIFQELDVAFAFHANTCEHAAATMRFFERSIATHSRTS